MHKQSDLQHCLAANEDAQFEKKKDGKKGQFFLDFFFFVKLFREASGLQIRF